ncbi:hypothetical protein U1Q18_012788 [Sarracenia purpurea var. burkii]
MRRTVVSKWVPTNQAAPVMRIDGENHGAATSARQNPVVRTAYRARKIRGTERRFQVTERWRSRQPKVTEEDYSQAEIGEDFEKGRRRRKRRVKTLAPSSTGATISGVTLALFSGDFASAGLACVIRASCVDSEESSKVFGAKRLGAGCTVKVLEP